MEQKMLKNIRILRYYKSLRQFIFALAIIVPFFNSLGLDQGDIYALQAIFSLTLVLSEVPSGYFADVVGRRTSLIVGQLLGFAAWMLYVFVSGFWGIALAEVLLGLGYSFVSGADDSLRYDSLLALGKEKQNLREDSRALARSAMSEGIAGLIGGALALSSLQAPIVAQAIWALLILPLPFFLTEAPRSKMESTSHPWRAVMKITKYALHTNHSVKWLVLYAAAISSLTYTGFWLIQPSLLEAGIALAWFGPIWFLFQSFLAVVGWKADAIKNRLGLERAIVVLPIIGVATYAILGAGYALWVLPAWLAHYFVRGVQIPVMKDEINKLIPSDFRATVLSVQGLVTRLFFIVFGLGFGYLSGVLTVRQTILASAAVYAVICTIAAAGLMRTAHVVGSE